MQEQCCCAPELLNAVHPSGRCIKGATDLKSLTSRKVDYNIGMNTIHCRRSYYMHQFLGWIEAKLCLLHLDTNLSFSLSLLYHFHQFPIHKTFFVQVVNCQVFLSELYLKGKAYLIFCLPFHWSMYKRRSKRSLELMRGLVVE